MFDVNTTVSNIKNTLVVKCGKYQKCLYNLRLIYPMVFIIYLI